MKIHGIKAQMSTNLMKDKKVLPVIAIQKIYLVPITPLQRDPI